MDVLAAQYGQPFASADEISTPRSERKQICGHVSIIDYGHLPIQPSTKTMPPAIGKLRAAPGKWTLLLSCVFVVVCMVAVVALYP